MGSTKPPKAAENKRRASAKQQRSTSDDIRNVLAEETDDNRISGARKHNADGLTITKRQRHDRGYVPRGYALRGDRLLRDPDDGPPMTASDRDLAGAAIEILQSCLAGADDFTPELRDACESIFVHVHGHPIGEVWRRVLADLLREQAERQQAERITGNASEWPPVRTPAEILARLRERCAGEHLPDFVSTEAIGVILDAGANIGGAGGRGKQGRTPEQWIEWLVEQARKGSG